MKAFKKLALRALLTKEQRLTILNSVAYSEHKYRVHGDIDGAVRVGTIRREIEKIIPAPKTKAKYTEQQVDRIVKVVLDDFVKWLRSQGDKKVTRGTVTVIDKEKCDDCENRDTCELKKVLFPSEGSDAEGNTTTPEEDASSAQEKDANEENASASVTSECDTVGTQAAAEKINEGKESGE